MNKRKGLAARCAGPASNSKRKQKVRNRPLFFSSFCLFRHPKNNQVSSTPSPISQHQWHPVRKKTPSPSFFTHLSLCSHLFFLFPFSFLAFWCVFFMGPVRRSKRGRSDFENDLDQENAIPQQQQLPPTRVAKKPSQPIFITYCSLSFLSTFLSFFFLPSC